MNNHHNIDVYATPSIAVLGSLAELTQTRGCKKDQSACAWGDNSNPGEA